MILDVYDPNTPGLDLNSTGEDYVSEEQIKDLILRNNIVPVSQIDECNEDYIIII